MGVDPDDPNRGARPGCLFQSGNYTDRGRVVAREDEDAIPVLARLGNQAGSVRAEAPDVQSGAAFLPQRWIEVGLMRTGETNACGA